MTSFDRSVYFVICNRKITDDAKHSMRTLGPAKFRRIVELENWSCAGQLELDSGDDCIHQPDQLISPVYPAKENWL